ncbi:MAG: mechanosensitive ion channel family protein [Cyanobacteria bacterium P01_C01_bin.121]
MSISLSEQWLPWGLGLMVFFPLIMVGLAELVLKLKQRQHPMVKVIQELRNWVMPLSALFFLLTKVLELDKSTLPIQVIETLAWVSLIVAALSFVNVLLFTGAKPGTWQNDMPKLFRDLVRTVLIAMGIAIVLSAVFGVDLGGAFAALGVGGIVVGFALQDTLGNLFSGVALLFERPFDIGDWLEVDGQIGKVIEVNWRSVHIMTRNLEQLIVPNSSLAQSKIRNYNRPSPRHREGVAIGFSYNDAPNKVKRVMREAALDTAGVLSQPAPIVQTISYDDSSIGYRVYLFLDDYSKVPTIRDEFTTRIWYAARRNGLSIPFPIRDVYHHPVPKESVDEPIRRLANYMKSLPSLAMVEDKVLEEIATHAQLAHFGKGESAIYQNQQNVKLHFILAGSAIATSRDADDKQYTIDEMTRGDCFGYSAILANEPSPMTVTASEDLEVLILEAAAVQKMLNKTPTLSQQLAMVIDARQSKLKAITLANNQSGSLLFSSR